MKSDFKPGDAVTYFSYNEKKNYCARGVKKHIATVVKINKLRVTIELALTGKRISVEAYNLELLK